MSRGKGFETTPIKSKPAEAALDVALVLPNSGEFGHPGHPPLPGHERTGLPCAFNPVPAVIAAIVVHYGAVTIG